jgi:hypothetical protein
VAYPPPSLQTPALLLIVSIFSSSISFIRGHAYSSPDAPTDELGMLSTRPSPLNSGFLFVPLVAYPEIVNLICIDDRNVTSSTRAHVEQQMTNVNTYYVLSALRHRYFLSTP